MLIVFLGLPGLVREQHPNVLGRSVQELVAAWRQLLGYLARHERGVVILRRLVVRLRSVLIVIVSKAPNVCPLYSGTGANLTAATIPDQFFPGTPGNLVTQYPEG